MSNKPELIENPEITDEQAKQIMQLRAQKHITECDEEIAAALTKHTCILVPAFIATSEGNAFRLQLNYKGNE